MMLAGPQRANWRPKRAAPVEPGHRGQLARLIRERPVSVNVARCRIGASTKPLNLLEYIHSDGVFVWKDGGAPVCACDREPPNISDP